jgi:hypothetical protein
MPEPTFQFGVGPRTLPDNGWAEIWIDSGAVHGYKRLVPVVYLTLAADDDGQGEHAVYALAEGWATQSRMSFPAGSSGPGDR